MGGLRGGQPEFQAVLLQASIEPRRRRSVITRHAIKEPRPAAGKELGSLAITDLAPYGLQGPGAGRI